MIRSVIGVALIAFAMPLQAQLATLSTVADGGAIAGRSLAVATAYVNAYLFRNMDQLSEFWTDSTVMRDRAFGVEQVGRDSLMVSVPAGWAGVEVSAIRVNHRMAGSSGIVVLSLEGDGSIESDGLTLNFSVPLTLILRVRDNHIMEHDDFPDYECLNQQILAQSNGRLPHAALPSCGL